MYIVVEIRNRKVPFRFYNMWTNHLEFLVIVGKVWVEQVEDYSMFSIYQKLGMLRRELKRLDRREFCHISEQVHKFISMLSELQFNLQIDPF